MSVKVPPQLPSKTPTPIAFVGEAPGSEEVTMGKPLVGPSGRVFNALLRTANLERSDYLVTNVYDEKAPGNDVTEWMNDEDRTDTALKRLGAELTAAQPNVIVALGGTALWALTGVKKIGAYRGSVTPATRVMPGAKVIPTFHPAFVRKQWKMFPIVVDDFLRAAREARRGPQITYPKRRLILEPSLKTVQTFLKNAVNTDVLSVDIETGWGQITSVGFAPDAENAISVPFVDLRKPNKSYWGSVDLEVAAWQAVGAALEHPVRKLGQNFLYDGFWLLEKMGIRVRNYDEDTRLLHHAIYAELPKDLAFLGAAYSEQGAWKQWGGTYTQEKRDA